MKKGPTEEPVLQSLPFTDRIKKVLWNAGRGDRTDRGIYSELRREQRLAVDSRGICTIAGRFEREPIKVKDLSLSGLQFEIRRSVEMGELCQLFICLPGMAPTRLTGVVCWVDPPRSEGGEIYRIGVKVRTDLG